MHRAESTVRLLAEVLFCFSQGGPTPYGARLASLTEATKPYLEEVALNEQARYGPLHACMRDCGQHMQGHGAERMSLSYACMPCQSACLHVRLA